MTSLDLVIQCAWKGTVILAAAFVGVRLLRRGPAAVRHFVWTVALTALLLLPLALKVGQASRPALVVSAMAVVQAAFSISHSTGVPQVTPPVPTPAWPLMIWMLGGAVTAAWFLMGAARTRWMLRGASEAVYARAVVDGAGARVIDSPAVPMPMAWGIRRPVILLPEAARDWPEARLRTVLLHELTHVERRDLLAQAFAQMACCLYWFHPLVWLAARWQRTERELACDDAVLGRGVPPHEYAGHLMDLVRTLAMRRGLPADAPAMAESSELESRVRSLLDRARNRRPLTRRAALAIASLACCALLSLATLTTYAQARRGSISGKVEDVSGARVPRCRVSARNLDGANREVTRADAAGEYRFGAIPPGRYAIEFTAPGFARTTAEVVLLAGAALQADATLEIGEISEALTIEGQRAAPAPAARTAQRIRVGGNVQPTKLIRQVKPVYPDQLKQAGVQGTVVIRAVISTSGEVLNPQVVNTDVDPGLAQAALDAVRQWQYQPTLLNGQPVEVVTTVTLDFQLAR